MLFTTRLTRVHDYVMKPSSLLGPEKFENAALFLKLGLSSMPIRHKNGVFRKRSSNWRNFKTLAFRFRVDDKHFENGAFRKRKVVAIIV